MSQILSAERHPDGEWDLSMSDIDGEDLGWQDSITLVTSDGTEITLDQWGRIKVNGDFEIKERH